MIVSRLGIQKSVLISEARGGGRMHSNTTANNLRSYYCCGCLEKHHHHHHHHQGYNTNIPKLEAFNRSKFDRVLKDPPLISKSQNQLADYCTLLEGEDAYSCWQAYFELKHLEKVYSKEEVEKLIIESGGVKSLIGCLHGVASILKHNSSSSSNNNNNNNTNNTNTLTHSSVSPTLNTKTQQSKVSDVEPQHMHVPDGLPKTALEIEEEENSRMPDSAYTRLLRFNTSTATHPPWY